MDKASTEKIYAPDMPVDIIGRSCRLPGASDVEAFWDLLAASRCSVTSVNPERFSMFRYKSPRRGERGKSYSFAAGVLDDIWGFDPAVFSISPREAAQMDPQQRLLLMLVWEALEDAGLPPSELAGRNVGVYVGNSGIDHNNRFFFDPAGTDPYMMTGNTGALISNRISYIFDLHGPSMTIDTACSSSLVALDEAVNALRAGQIDTAIVAGVSLLLSPFPFVGFSAASMLSEQGLCRPFDKDAYGYVRAEGGVVLVLQRSGERGPDTAGCHARIVETGVNSDGRTVGVALPSADYQARLLEEVYGRAGVEPASLAFIEAHGTGTRVGDPAEAAALGRILGQPRPEPLPVGSVKSNIGHLEPASGIAGLLKAMLALEHDLLPASLHFRTPNPDIPFDELNIRINDQPRKLARQDARRFAGVSNFGFGGTNVHVILTDPPAPGKNGGKGKSASPQTILLLSAQCRGALKALAGEYAERLGRHGGPDAGALMNAALWRRERMAERLVVFGDDPETLVNGLNAFAGGKESAGMATGRAAANDLAVALVYSGNGSQWAGMGQGAFNRSERFRATFRQIDRLFTGISGWSLEQSLFAGDLAEQLKSTRTAQPLLFALQVALTDALREMGLDIRAVIGHSVGEVAAGWASGALTLEQAVRIIHARSEHQENVRGKGLMVAVMLPEAEVQGVLDSDDDFSGICVSAVNSARSVTVSGPTGAIEHFIRHALRNNWLHKLLDIDYPFHNALIDPVREDLIGALEDIRPGETKIPYYSTVTGTALAGSELTADYWWDNIRQPVRFNDAVMNAARAGCRLFLEIGPKPVLYGYLNEITGELEKNCSVARSFTPDDAEELDPVQGVFARAIALGASFDATRVFGPRSQNPQDLPLYPWQKKTYSMKPSRESIEAFLLTVPPHPLLGQPLRVGEYVWDVHIDTQMLPFLNDHKVDGKVILPGAAFAEMFLEVARQWLDTERIELRDMDIVQALVLGDDYTVEIQTRLSIESGTVEIASRKRLSDDEWQLHAKCRVGKIPGDAVPQGVSPELRATNAPESVARLYDLSKRHGLEFGPRFQRMIRCDEVEDNIVEVVLDLRDPALDPSDGESSRYNIHPLDLDGCFHGLNVLYDKLDLGNDKLAFIPVRLGTLRVYLPGVPVRTARITILRSNRRGGQGNFELFAEDGRLVARLDDARFRAAALMQRHTLDRTSYSITCKLLPLPGKDGKSAAPEPKAVLAMLGRITDTNGVKLEEQRLLRDAAARRVAYDILVSLGDGQGRIDMTALTGSQALGPGPDESGSINPRMAIFSNLLVIAEQSGLAEPDDEGWKLADVCPLPPAAELMQAVLAEEPRWLADCVLLNRAANLLPELLSGAPAAWPENRQAHDIYSPAMLEQLAASSPIALAHIEKIASIMQQIIAGWPQGRPLRVLELGIGGGGLTRKLLPMIAAKHGTLIAADTNRHSMNRLEMTLGESVFFTPLMLGEHASALDDIEPVDLLVSANGLHMLSNHDQLVESAAARLADGAVMVISTSEPDAFHDLVFGPVEGWFDNSVDPRFPLGPMRNAGEWIGFFDSCGLGDSRSLRLAKGLESAAVVIAARHGDAMAAAKSEIPEPGDLAAANTESGPACKIIITTSGDEAETGFARRLSQVLTAEERHGEAISPAIFEMSQAGQGGPESWAGHWDAVENADARIVDIVHLAGAFEDSPTPMAALCARTDSLTGMLQALGSRHSGNIRLWILAPGGVRAGVGAGQSSPVQSGIWAFVRTATNEYGEIDFRLVDFASELDEQACAERLASLLSVPGRETELVLTRQGMLALRVRRGLPQMPPGAAKPGKTARLERRSDSIRSENALEEKGEAEEKEAAVLTHPTSGSLDQMNWSPMPRRAPGPGEVEIAVAATGLNFRDVMWAQGLLPEEALEDGFAGPTLGFECSGRITAVGGQVGRLKVGDPVMALAPSCFASHVRVSDIAVARLPATVELAAAATIPVAFLTAYYALHHLAHLDEGEWLLIHGAAGGVGLAALQVAKWRKARVIATAGSDEKRSFLAMLGADHVLNTRSLDFVDQVRTITAGADGGGVDVVLNSLSGEAMERSIELVRPFGRFLELGKRDFYGNTKIGLRPFRRNLSYFGIDADQLLGRQPELSRRLFGELTQMFEQEEFKPLPYRLFESGEVIEAFRLMQQSGHVGKILVRPPEPRSFARNIRDEIFRADKKGVHIIIGGLGGFGLEAALWLADHGARSIVLTGRSGKLNEQAQETISRLQKTGVKVEIKRCDVADKKALEQLLANLRNERPIRGIMHAAMVLEDELIQNLAREQVEKVLRPKVEGADNLDRLTRQDDLDYFVLFSSAAALFGNPGQAHYVAANAYLDGLARRRRLENLPALAIGWGAITDVGVLARQKDTAKSLARHTGGMEFRARQALDLLGQLLACGGGAPEQAVVALAAMNWAFAGDTLPIMKKPVFTMMAHEAMSSGGASEIIDIFEIIKGLDDAEAQKRIARLLAEEVSVIIRMPAKEISLKRSLTDIGMDSLMGMELGTAAQQKLGITIPMVSIADGTTINDIAARVLARVRSGSDDELERTDEILVKQHVKDDLDKTRLKEVSDEVARKRDEPDESS